MFLIESKAYHILTKTSSLAMCSPQAHTSPPNTFSDCSKNKRHSKYQFFIKLIMHQHIIIKVRNNMIRNSSLTENLQQNSISVKRAGWSWSFLDCLYLNLKKSSVKRCSNIFKFGSYNV